ncbi:MAG: GNAT family N-acetyltransferase [Chloroflexota bacterium]
MSTPTGTPRTDWQLRVPARDELSDFVQPVQLAFGGGFSDEKMADWLKHAEPDRWLGASEPGSDLVVGAASVFSVRLTVPGGEVPAAAVTGVGVRPDYRRRGVLRALMARQLADVRERGEPLALLWASEGTIYQRFGYGLSAYDGYLEIDAGRTAFVRERPVEGHVRIVGEDEAAILFPPVYERMRRATPGAISRTDRWWRLAVLADPPYGSQRAGPKYRVVYERGGRPEGYAIYRIRDEWDERGPRDVLEVAEAVTTTPEAVRGLWRYLFDVDLVRTVKAWRVPLPTPLQHVLAEPRQLGLTVKDGIWARLVDLPAALAARRYGLADSIVLEVTDAFCDWNAGRWRLRTEGAIGEAVASVERTDGPVDVVLDTADLAALYLGAIHPAELAAVGRIEERGRGALRRLAALCATDVAPWCTSMF